ncbi:MAG: HAMP domain-containing sensor histidine kinase [Pseudomonadota bacterium]
MRFRRLSTQIYLTILASLILIVVIVGFTFPRNLQRGPVRDAFGVTAELAAAALPGPQAELAKQRSALNDLARKLRIDIALFNRERQQIVASDNANVRPPPRRVQESGFLFRRGRFAWGVLMPDGRWLVAQSRRRGPPRGPWRLLAVLAFVSVIVGLCAWPVVRGLTQRLERLQSGVENLGEGNLAARVDVRGTDEVAALANSFNSAAERIERLVNSHRLLLANASHELRTPLARIRMGLELLDSDAGPRVRQELERDIGELDDIIEEILLLSRLDAGVRSDIDERVDFLALVAEEAARYGDCTLEGAPAHITGDPTLLRRLVRNLLENAQRHGRPPVTVALTSSGVSNHLSTDQSAADKRTANERRPNEQRNVVLVIADTGDGISPAHQEAVFRPFHRGATAGSSRKGTGLGLALARQIAIQHRGTIQFLPDAKGRLNTIEVRLPLASE